MRAQGRFLVCVFVYFLAKKSLLDETLKKLIGTGGD